MFSRADWKVAKRDTQEFMSRSPQQSVNENWKSLRGHIEKIMSSHVPSRMSKTKLDLPWLILPHKQALRRKNKPYARKSKNDTWNKFKEARRSTQRGLRKAES